MATAKKSPAKKAAKGKKSAPKKATARKAAAKKKPAPKKPAPLKAPPRKKTRAKAGAAGASAPRAAAASNAGADSGFDAGAGREALQRGFENMKPRIAAAADAIESKVTDLIDKADVQNFPDKLWRLLAMIAFAFVGYWVFVATVILAAMQWVVVLLGDKPSPEIAHYMGRCSAYVIQILDLLSYRSESLPWPLGPLPGEEAGE